jgi:hypothetical protein
MQHSQITLHSCWLNLAAKAFSGKIQLELMNQSMLCSPKPHEPNKLQFILSVLPSPLQPLDNHPVVATVVTNCSELVGVIEATAYNLICC